MNLITFFKDLAKYDALKILQQTISVNVDCITVLLFYKLNLQLFVSFKLDRFYLLTCIEYYILASLLLLFIKGLVSAIMSIEILDLFINNNEKTIKMVK